MTSTVLVQLETGQGPAPRVVSVSLVTGQGPRTASVLVPLATGQGPRTASVLVPLATGQYDTKNVAAWGFDSSALPQPAVQHHTGGADHYVYVPGAEVVDVGVAQAYNKTKYVALAGSPNTLAFGEGTYVQNWVRYAYPPGVHHAGYGAAYTYKKTQIVYPVGLDPALIGGHSAENRNRLVQAAGVVPATPPSPTAYNRNLFVWAAGVAPYALPAPTVTRTEQYITPAGSNYLSFGATNAGVRPVGSDYSATGFPWIGSPHRQLHLDTNFDAASVGTLYAENHTKEIHPVGVQALATSTGTLVRDKTSYVRPDGPEFMEFGTWYWVGPQWVGQVLPPDHNAFGRILVGRYEPGVKPTSIPPKNRYGLAYVYNNARKLFAGGLDSASVPAPLSVADRYRSVYPSAMDENTYPNYTVVYKAAAEVYAGGIDCAGFSTGVSTEQRNKTVRPVQTDMVGYGSPFVDYAVRKVFHVEARDPETIVGPTVQNKTQYVGVRPTDEFTRMGATTVESHVNKASFFGTSSLVIGVPALHKLTPEVYFSGADSAATGTARVYNYRQFVAPVGESYAYIDKAFAARRNRTITPDPYNATGFGVTGVSIDMLSAPIPRTLFVGSVDASAAGAGTPRVYSNRVYAVGIPPRNAYGVPSPDMRSIVFDSSRDVFYESGGTHPAVYNDFADVSRPVVLAKYTRSVYPVSYFQETYTGRPQVFPFRWYFSGIDGMAINKSEVQHKHRTVSVRPYYNESFSGPKLYNKTQKVYPNELDGSFFGWHEAFGGVREVDPYSEASSDAYGVPTVQRPVVPPVYDPYLRPVGADMSAFGSTRAELFNRSIYPVGRDQFITSTAGSEGYWQGNYVGRKKVLSMLGTDMQQFGTLWASMGLREIMLTGDDMFETLNDGEELRHFTVSTAPVKGPTQYIFAHGAHSCQCCWGFFIGHVNA